MDSTGFVKRTVWEYAFFLAAGIGVLAKGPVSLVLVWADHLFFSLSKKMGFALEARVPPRRFRCRRSNFSSWYGSALWIGGEKFFGLQFIKENFARFFVYGEGGTGHQKPVYYFISYLFTLGFPWTLLLPFIFFDYFRWKNFTDDRDLFLGLWVAVIFIFFSLSAGKRPPYILPLYPPLALLMAVGIRQMATSVAYRARRTADPCVARGGHRRGHPASGVEQPVRPRSVLAFSCY